MQRAKGTDRILDILDFFENSDGPVTRNAIAGAISCPRSTLYTLVDTLIDRGWLNQTSDGQISPGNKFARMGFAYARHAKFEQIAREIIGNLAKETGEVIELNIIDNWKQLIVLSATLKEHSYLRTVEGAMVPVPATAAGRVLLTDIPAAIIARHVPASDFTLNSGNRVSLDEFVAEIEQAKKDGYFVGYKLIDDFVSTIAVPVYNQRGERIGAVSIVMPTSHLESDVQNLVDRLRRTAEQISDFLKLTPWDLGQSAYDKIKNAKA
ncbi:MULTISPECIES: IclR family transcriptional regulator [Kaistia]|uniref:IclR family transcriptional regulator n=1 Tax=Kaistia nematophila TaxID=2994654 RepID=A0A9X3E3Y7_9HYPH|nr:IclR family transcriptional regulator [Kaistia nematophila]MCX5571361.1 IclR family transcriptional regulator [Kaistia nematophila]